MKRTLLSTLVITSTLGLSANVFALGMGELELKSTLNQPLQAEIELTNIDDLTEWEIKPSLASDGDFDRAGVEKIFFLSDIDFEIKGNRIILSSDKSVTEPFLNFLVQVNWPSGRVLREYTLLLDPPVFDETIQPLSANELPQRVESQAVTPAAQAPQANRWESESAAPGTYKVQPNDTLWEIAINTRPSRAVSPQQMMLAIQDSNPSAFIGGNINRLKTHQVLRIPNQQQVADRNNGQAVSEVLRQNNELQTAGAQLDATRNAAQTNKAEQLQDGGELKLLSKQNEVADSAGASGDVESGVADGGRSDGLQNELAIALETLDTNKLENKDLKDRLASLEEQIATLQRLVSLKDDQLASIQTIELQNEEALTAEAINPPQTEEIISTDSENEIAITEDASEVELGQENEDFNYVEEPLAAETETLPAEIETVQLPDTSTEIDAEVAANQIQQHIEDRYKPKGLVAQVMAKPEWLAGIGGGLALLLGLIGFAIKKRKAAKEEGITDPELAAFDENYEFEEGELDEASLDDFELEDDDLTSDELNDDLLEGIGATEDDEIAEDSADTVAQTADIIGEAEIYIAYGRFDQAADLLKNSIQQEPSRIDLRIKLLEVFTETDDATSFAEAELDLNTIGDIEANEKALAMRNRLSSPITGEDNDNAAQLDDLALDSDDDIMDIEGLADAGDDFSDGIDFEAALDLSDEEPSDISSELDLEGDDFAASLDALEDDSFDEGLEFDLGDLSEESPGDNSLELDLTSEDEVPTLDDLSAAAESLDDIPTLDDSEFDLTDTVSPDAVDFDEPSIDSEEAEAFALDSEETLDLADLEDIPTLDTDLEDIPTLDTDLEDIPTLDTDLGDLAELDELANSSAAEVDNSLVELAALDNSEGEDVASLEDLLDAEGSLDSDLPDLSFELDGTGFESDLPEDLGGDLQALEAELDELTEPTAPVIEDTETLAELESDNLEPLSKLDEASAFEASAEFEGSSEFDLNELEDLPDFTEETIEKDIAAPATQGSQEIDLDELAASDNEFDFLAGTDECATKLDLARAYMDMEDNEGAKELLLEVVAEGSDQQKQDARALMDSIG